MGMILICPLHNWGLHQNRLRHSPNWVGVKRRMMLTSNHFKRQTHILYLQFNYSIFLTKYQWFSGFSLQQLCERKLNHPLITATDFQKVCGVFLCPFQNSFLLSLAFFQNQVLKGVKEKIENSVHGDSVSSQSKILPWCQISQYYSICPSRNLVGECLPQTLLY